MGIPMATRLVLFAACTTLASSSQVDLEAVASVCEGGACVGGEYASLLQVRILKHEDGDQDGDGTDTAVANDAEAAHDTEAETTGACTADDLETLKKDDQWGLVVACISGHQSDPSQETYCLQT